MQGIVRGLLAHIKAAQPKRGSFAALLLGAKDPATGRPLTDVQMFPEIAALFFAGIDTTGHTGADGDSPAHSFGVLGFQGLLGFQDFRLDWGAAAGGK